MNRLPPRKWLFLRESLLGKQIGAVKGGLTWMTGEGIERSV